jgi:uncharacterized metal-binding protein
MPNARTHDAITYALTPFTFLAAEMYWGSHVISALATAMMLFSGLMFGPDLDLNSRPYQRWGPLKFIWKPYQAALPHRSKLSHGPVLGTVIRIVYFLLIASVLGATILYLRHRFIHYQQTTWGAEFAVIRNDLFSFWDQTDKKYFWSAFGGLWLGALAHTTADVVWSSVKRTVRGRRRR